MDMSNCFLNIYVYARRLVTLYLLRPGKVLFAVGSSQCRDSKLVKVLRMSDCWVSSPKWKISINATTVAQETNARKDQRMGACYGMLSSGHDMVIALMN